MSNKDMVKIRHNAQNLLYLNRSGLINDSQFASLIIETYFNFYEKKINESGNKILDKCLSGSF